MTVALVGIADLHTSISNTWDNAPLDPSFEQPTLTALFKSYWLGGDNPNFQVIEEDEAAAGHTFPYCVIETANPNTKTRMSGRSGQTSGVQKYENRDIDVTFNIHSKAASGSSAKQIAALMASAVMSVFGGHPTISPQSAPTLQNGAVLITQYTTDFCVRTELYHYRWSVKFRFRCDIPIMVA